ncbi:DinB family protein [Paenibacillus radicis (ex Xue et al. 2023)]|uniref:DinB family protein n=1 Tax=Paenibacillus radicis (ex Xue et al. 2023) TaxID=2972489 RepID=A0ABT1YQ13_9BACL|nr:DinB family protein [Paenibacillus radicis (ex Xue et al. 2023)]MCR8635112.1 DinB family protein [Paenibacillus radicis (ex Xue et al. 2023)]
MIQRPDPAEHDPYYERYIQLVPSDDLLAQLRKQLTDTLELLQSTSEMKASYRYAPGKWSLREVVGHMADTERIMSYRLLRVSRGDATPIAGFDEDAYAKAANYEAYPMHSILDEFSIVRKSTLFLLERITPEAWGYWGTSNNSKITARALGYIIAGHELHHRSVIQARYL